ncbi:MAG: sugar nucleotide-binding protein, partial [Candidatus Aminicenantes bacterium]|nr:sugar nucleotide-binding protein [Candidatus Aminicenantes bacterium]
MAPGKRKSTCPFWQGFCRYFIQGIRILYMNILITGGNGQLGWELNRSIPGTCKVYSCSKSDLDITDSKRVLDEVRDFKPDCIINTAAYTAV